MFKKVYTTLILIFIGCVSFLHADDSLQQNIDSAAVIIQEFEKMPNQVVPPGVVRKAQGFVILNMAKAAAGASSREGSGIVIARTANGWSAPSAVTVSGAGIGLKVGPELTDFVLVLNTKAAVDAFAGGKEISLGVTIPTAPGPIGQTGNGAILPFAAIYSYSKNQDLFIGVSVEGTVVREGKEENKSFYGAPVTAADLLYGKIPPPPSAQPLYNSLSQINP